MSGVLLNTALNPLVGFYVTCFLQELVFVAELWPIWLIKCFKWWGCAEVTGRGNHRNFPGAVCSGCHPLREHRLPEGPSFSFCVWSYQPWYGRKTIPSLWLGTSTPHLSEQVLLGLFSQMLKCFSFRKRWINPSCSSVLGRAVWWSVDFLHCAANPFW